MMVQRNGGVDEKMELWFRGMVEWKKNRVMVQRKNGVMVHWKDGEAEWWSGLNIR